MLPAEGTVADRVTLYENQQEIARKRAMLAAAPQYTAAPTVRQVLQGAPMTPPPYTPAPYAPPQPSGTLKQRFLEDPTRDYVPFVFQNEFSRPPVYEDSQARQQSYTAPNPFNASLANLVPSNTPAWVRNPLEQASLGNAAMLALSGAGVPNALKWTGEMAAGQMAGGGIGRAVGGETGEQIGGTAGALIGPFAPALARAGVRAAPKVGEALSTYMKKQATFGYPEEQLMSRTVTQAAEEAPKAAEALSSEQKLTNMVTHAGRARKAFADELGARRAESAKKISVIREQVRSGELTWQEAGPLIGAARKGPIDVRYTFPAEWIPTEAEIAEIQGKIAAANLKPQDFANTRDSFVLLMSRQHLQPRQIKFLGKVLGPDFEAGLTKLMADPMKFRLWREAIDALNLPRTTFASYDISFPLRQGIGLIGEEEWFRAWKPMMKSIRWSDTNAKALYDEILADPYWEKYGEMSGIAVADPLGTVPGITQEQFIFRDTLANQFAKKFPGIKQSQFAYTSFGNKLRWGVFKKYIKIMENSGKPFTEADVKRVGTVVNMFSGWGKLGNLEKVLPELSTVIFSPRFWASQIERVPYGIYAAIRTPALRPMVARNLGAFVSANMAMLGLLKLSGVADVELDPRSTDFGRARIGPTRIDVTGGLGKTLRFFVQQASGTAKAASTGTFYPVDRMKDILREIQGHLSPAASLGVDIITGTTFVGEPMEATKSGFKAQFWNRMVPGFIQDTVDAIRAQGPMGALVGPLAATGASVLTYQTPFDKQRALYDTVAKEKGYSNFDDMAAAIGTPKASEIAKADQRVIDLQPEIEKYKTLRGGTANRSMTDVRNDYVGAQDEDDTAVGNGTMTRKVWLDNYKERQQNLGSAYAEYLKENPDMAAKLAETAKDLNPFALPVTATPDQVRAAYFKLFDAYKGPDQLISQEAWGKLDPEIDRFRTGLTPTQLTSLDENLAAGKSPLVQEYKADQQKLQPYWDMQDTLWTEFAAKNAKLAPFANVPYQDFLKNLGDQYVSEGKSADYANMNGYVKAFNKFLDARTQRYIFQNPEIDALRNIWGYTEGVHSPAAARIYEARMGVKPRLIKPS